jgi:hypothetical protein
MTEKESESKLKEIKVDKNCIFAKENINMGHQPEFDYLKTLGVFLITISHIYLNYSHGILYDNVFYIVTILTAGALMILMGIGMKYSRHHEPKHYFARAIVLLTMGQYLNIIRDSLPNLIAWWATGKPKFISRALLVWQTDILTFAGFSFILLAIFKMMKLSDGCILIIGIIMNFASYPLFLIMKQPNNYLLSQLLGYFVLTKAEAYFPLIGYFVFVAFGYWIAGYYQKMANKDKFYNRILIFCLPIVCVYQYFRINNRIPTLPEYNCPEHYCLSPGPDSIHRIFANMVTLAIFYKLDKFLGKTPEFISHCGKNLNQYYMISYVITMQMNVFMKAVKGEEYPSQFKQTDLFTFMLLVFSRILIDMNDKYIHFTIITLKNPLRKIVFTLIWITSIITVIYVYPKVEAYANIWNDYLNDE